VIDLHTHSFFSDGALSPSELIRRAVVHGYKAIAITDHLDASNIELVIPHVGEACEQANAHWDIQAIPGAELTHIPPETIPELARRARAAGARIVLVHGETIVEPVCPGTNRAALEADIDILAHPGLITEEEAEIASQRGIHLEITTRRGHSLTNGHVARLARQFGARLVLSTDAHEPDDLIGLEQATRVARGAGMTDDEIGAMFASSEELIAGIGK
jgi:histidinol phosphatase-like PHP family hydrolase